MRWTTLLSTSCLSIADTHIHTHTHTRTHTHTHTHMHVPNRMLGTYNTSDSSPMEITLPNNLIATDESSTDKAVCVRAMDGKSKLTVIAFNDEFASTGTFQASPFVFLPNQLYEFFVVTSSKTVDPEDVEDAYKAMFMVVTTEDNTAITLTLTVSLNLIRMVTLPGLPMANGSLYWNVRFSPSRWKGSGLLPSSV